MKENTNYQASVRSGLAAILLTEKTLVGQNCTMNTTTQQQIFTTINVGQLKTKTPQTTILTK